MCYILDNIMPIEQRDTQSFRFDENNMEIIRKYNLEDNSPSQVLNLGLENLDQNRQIRRKYEDFKNGHITLGQLLDYLEKI